MTPGAAQRPPHRVRVHIHCRDGHEHEICFPIGRAVSPDLRCDGDESAGYSGGGGGSGCTLPADLGARVERELRDHYQDARRRGWVQVDLA